MCGILFYDRGPVIWDLTIQAGIRKVRVGRGLRSHQFYLCKKEAESFSLGQRAC